MAERPELSEDVDLDLETRRYVLDLYDRIDRLTHYEVLGVPPNADKKTIRRTYFRLAGLLHPDRYFAKKIGTYKPKLEAVFARATMAFEEISSPEKRAKYDLTLGAGGGVSPVARPAAPVDPRMVAKRQSAIDDLKKRFEQNALMAKRHAETARRARALGDLVAAIEAYEMALTYAPRDEALRAAHAELQQSTAQKLGETLEKQALLEERFGQWAEAARSWQAVVDARPDDEKARAKLALAQKRAQVAPSKG